MPGPFYLALVGEGETEFGPEHLVEHFDILSFAIEHSEGNAAKLTIEVRNPQVGLLAPGRNRWGWFSGPSVSGTVPLFFGRLMGIPSNILGEAVTLEFVAKPLDETQQKQELAETLRVAPYYDPIWIDEAHRDDPDTVLETYSALWDYNRTTHVISIGDILDGEDGEEEFTADEVPYDSVNVTLGQAPQNAIRVEASAPWSQAASGTVEILKPTVVNTYTGLSLLNEWPKVGASLGKGWTAAEGTYARDLYGTDKAQTYSVSWDWKSGNKEHVSGDTLSASVQYSAPILRSAIKQRLTIEQTSVTGDPEVSRPWSLSVNATYHYLPQWTLQLRLVLTYDAKIARSETATFILRSDIQDIVTLPESSPEPEDQEVITRQAANLDEPIDGIPPLFAEDGGSFFQTERGGLSLQYLLLLARAHLRLRARAVQVEFDCRFERAINLSCRMNARLFDHRLPGGEASGKIISYTISGDGDGGKLIGHVTMGCAIGQGGSVVSDVGEDLYIYDDYIDDYFEREGEIIAVTSDVGFTPPSYAAGGPAFPLTKSQAVISESWQGSLAEQIAIIEDNAPLSTNFIPPTLNAETMPSENDTSVNVTLNTEPIRSVQQIIEEALKDASIYYDLRLIPISEIKVSNPVDVPVTTLAIPKQIDLEAPAL